MQKYMVMFVSKSCVYIWDQCLGFFWQVLLIVSFILLNENLFHIPMSFSTILSTTSSSARIDKPRLCLFRLRTPSLALGALEDRAKVFVVSPDGKADVDDDPIIVSTVDIS
eukprot:92964_1